MDGYHKLSLYGIKIYACIDVYSRYIIWAYVGISSAIAVSYLFQFLETLRIRGIQPRFVRSDRGGETTRMANIQWNLRQVDDPEIPLNQCWMFGTSTSNQRIKAWWAQLSKVRVCA
ncbi:hypothetical protein EJ05DRAFT_96911 [Pseudovirgaria hyperparasitica]|uniref:Integrase core domain-containing protein n=1 Tax=Pseudovirgaria hyperparasitica TaxID=470096 RepID=A0A6A6VP01_9PEZI|nr:uncharacterized protein EJ05DRAFT_96911 [Pseudovirgaria hyperparasitica]KAF2752358.1 hypothetical protein EJ05DRAFT_96911 [Pseudovirgaria hyperparasitica]